MKESWERAIAFTLAWEGSGQITEDPNDPGGLTKWGISARYHPDVDIKNLSKEEAMGIYRRNYWDLMQCDALPFPLDIVAFDSSVNPGMGATQSFLAKSMDWRDVIMYRVQYFSDRGKKNPQYLRGWINRCISLWAMLRGKDA